MDLRGAHVYLRPVEAGDLPLLSSWVNNVAHLTEYNFFGLGRADGPAVQFQENGLLGESSGTLMVVTCKNDLIVGDVSYHYVFYGPGLPNAAYNMGIALSPEHRGKGYGVEAQRLLADYLLAAYPIMRVEATTDILNVAEQRALEKAGFTREGVLRKAQWRDGAYHDMVVYSTLRGE